MNYADTSLRSCSFDIHKITTQTTQVQPIVRDASTNLKRWRAAEDELRGAANKATSMMGKLDELQGVVGRLQENLAKVLPVHVTRVR